MKDQREQSQTQGKKGSWENRTVVGRGGVDLRCTRTVGMRSVSKVKKIDWKGAATQRGWEGGQSGGERNPDGFRFPKRGICSINQDRESQKTGEK